MKIQLKTRTLELPDQIFLDQLIQMDMSQIEQIEKLKSDSVVENMKLLKWMLDFFKILGVKERLTLQDFQEMQENNQLMTWFKSLFSGFQLSS